MYISGLLGARRVAAASVGRRLRLDVGAEALQVGDERDDFAVGGGLDARCLQAVGDPRGLRAQVGLAPAARSPSGYGTPSRRSVMILPSMCDVSSAAS